MWDSVITSGIAVAGTLAGSWVGGFVQLRGARAERRENQREARRAAALDAVTALSVALAEHRRATWVLEHQRLSGKDALTVDEARSVTNDTWAAVTVPLVRVKVLAPKFVGAAEDVTDAVYAMLGAPTIEVLETRRAVARTAHDRLMATAAAVFAGQATSPDPPRVTAGPGVVHPSQENEPTEIPPEENA